MQRPTWHGQDWLIVRHSPAVSLRDMRLATFDKQGALTRFWLTPPDALPPDELFAAARGMCRMQFAVRSLAGCAVPAYSVRYRPCLVGAMDVRAGNIISLHRLLTDSGASPGLTFAGAYEALQPRIEALWRAQAALLCGTEDWTLPQWTAALPALTQACAAPMAALLMDHGLIVDPASIRTERLSPPILRINNMTIQKGG